MRFISFMVNSALPDHHVGQAEELGLPGSSVALLAIVNTPQTPAIDGRFDCWQLSTPTRTCRQQGFERDNAPSAQLDALTIVRGISEARLHTLLGLSSAGSVTPRRGAFKSLEPPNPPNIDNTRRLGIESGHWLGVCDLGGDRGLQRGWNAPMRQASDRFPEGWDGLGTWSPQHSTPLRFSGQ